MSGFVTNVPGPVAPLSLAGSTVESIWPAALIAGNVRVGVAAVSYAGRLFCGIHFDAGHVDGTRIAAAMAHEFSAPTGDERDR